MLNTVTTVRDLPDGAVAVRRARLAAGLSLRAMAARIGVSPGTLSALENGHTRVSVERLQQVADVVGETAADLLVTPTPRFGPVSALGEASVVASSELGAWRRFEPLVLGPVVGAALAAFVDTGYHGATVRDIAARAGMSVAGLYHHHRSKQELLVALLEVTMADLRWRVDAARVSTDEPTDRVAAVVEALALFHTYRRDLAFIGASEMRSLDVRGRRRIAALRSGVQHALDTEVDAALVVARARGRGVDTASARLGARAVATMCTSLPQWFRVGGPTTPEELAVQYATYALALLDLAP